MAFAKKPAHRIRMGVVGASIFAQPTSKGVFYNTTFTRSFQNSQTGQWEDSYSFGIEDVCVLIQVASQAAAWVAWRVEENKRGNQQGEPAEEPKQQQQPVGQQPLPDQGRKPVQKTVQDLPPASPKNPGSQQYYEGYDAY